MIFANVGLYELSKLLNTSQLKELKEPLDYAMQICPENITVGLMLNAISQLNDKEYKEGIDLLKELIKRDCKNSLAYFALIRYYIKQGDHNTAFNYIE